MVDLSSRPEGDDRGLVGAAPLLQIRSPRSKPFTGVDLRDHLKPVCRVWHGSKAVTKACSHGEVVRQSNTVLNVPVIFVCEILPQLRTPERNGVAVQIKLVCRCARLRNDA